MKKLGVIAVLIALLMISARAGAGIYNLTFLPADM